MLHVEEIIATAAVNRDAFASRDEACNLVGRCWFTAFGELRHQIIQANHEHAAFADRAFVRLRADPVRIRRRFGGFGGGLAFEQFF